MISKIDIPNPQREAQRRFLFEDQLPGQIKHEPTKIDMQDTEQIEILSYPLEIVNTTSTLHLRTLTGTLSQTQDIPTTNLIPTVHTELPTLMVNSGDV